MTAQQIMFAALIIANFVLFKTYLTCNNKIKVLKEEIHKKHIKEIAIETVKILTAQIKTLSYHLASLPFFVYVATLDANETLLIYVSCLALVSVAIVLRIIEQLVFSVLFNMTVITSDLGKYRNTWTKS